MIRPLCGRVTPIAGESLASLLARSASANVLPSTTKLIRQAGVGSGQPAFIAFTQAEAAANLAALLGIPVDEVIGRMHRKLDESSNVIDWFGTPLERRFLEAPTRRFSSLGLKASDHIRAEWMVRPLAYCPDNFDLLRHVCPHCDAKLGWDRALGVSVCEQCEGDLRTPPTQHLAEPLRSAYSVVSGLISTDAARRAKSIKRFPDRFHDWRSGDLFSAIVDLGFARSLPSDPSNFALANGDFGSFTDEHLFLGLDLFMNWEDAFPAMIQATIDSNSSTAARGTAESLGPLRRFFYANSRQTALVGLMRREVPTALRKLNIPLRVARNSILLGAKREGTISLRDAKEKYRIDNRLLARLVDHADCFIARHASKFGTRLFDDAALKVSIDAYRSATTKDALSRILGVPPFIVDACEEAGLFRRISDRDAQLLAGDTVLYDTNSVTEFTDALERHDAGTTDMTWVSLLYGMRGQLLPMAWPTVFKALVEGKLKFQIDRDESRWSSAILVDAAALKRALRALPNDLLPDDLRLSMGNAAVLLGESSTSLGSAARAGLLKAEQHDVGYSVALRDLDNFHRAFVFSHELHDAHSNLDQPWRDYVDRAGLKPVGRFAGRDCWNRAAVAAAIG